MRIENILALTDASLLNTPVVSEFANTVFDLRHLKRGDLFVAFEQESIAEAVALGAYGILFEGEVCVSDEEIAWMRVDDLFHALVKIVRFTLIDKELEVFRCSDVVAAFASQLQVDSLFMVLHGDAKQSLRRLLEIESGSVILYSKEELTSDLFTHVTAFDESCVYEFRRLEERLFESSFVARDIFCENQQFSPLFLPKLGALFAFLQSKSLAFSFKKLSLKEHFEPLFVSNSLEIREFGSTQKVLIFEKNTHYAELEMEFLTKQTPWAKRVFIFPESLRERFSYFDEEIFYFKRSEEIVEFLQERHFHFALLIGVSKSILPPPKKEQLQLNF